MAQKREQQQPVKKRKRRSKTPTPSAKSKGKGKTTYRVETWFNGVDDAKGVQTQKAGWKPRGTYAARKLAVVQMRRVGRNVSTRIVSVPG